MDTILGVPRAGMCSVNNNAVAAAEGVFQVVRDLLKRFALREFIDNVHSPIVLIPGQSEDMIDRLLRNWHRKRNGRCISAHSFINQGDLFFFCRKQRELFDV